MISSALKDYFKWLVYIVDGRKYEKLLQELHSIDFTYILERDANRAADGEDLRWRYVCEDGNRSILQWEQPCSVLEMMVGLSIKMEDIMDDPEFGDRVSDWFWEMMDNMELSSMTNSRFDADYIHEKVYILLNREYEPDGKGGLFFIPDARKDLRDVEIWYQMNWYLDSIV